MDSSRDQQAADAPKNPIRIVSTNTATFSEESRRAIRSHAMSWSRRKRKEAKERRQSTSRSPTPETFTTPEAIDAQANSLTIGVVPSSYEAHPRTFTAVRRHRGSLLPVSQPVMQAQRSSKLSYTYLPNEDENIDPSSSKHHTQFGRGSEGNGDECFEFNKEHTWRDLNSQRQLARSAALTDKRRMKPDHQSWTLLKYPDTPSPATPLDTGHFASFATTAVPIDYKMAFFLNFFSTVIVQRIEMKSSMIHAYTTLLIPLAVEEPALLYAILLRTSTEFKSGGGDKTDQIVGPQTVIATLTGRNTESEHVNTKIKAIQHLRKRLSSGGGFINPAMIHAIAILLRAETLNGDLQDIKAHLMGLRQMQALGHSLTGVPGSISGPHLQSINLACAMTRTAPPFAPTVAEGAEFLINARRRLRGFSEPAFRLMASAFHDHETTSLLGHTLVQYAAYHREFVLFKYLISIGDVVASVDELELIFDVSHLADYRLLSLPFNIALSPIQESTRLALYISAWVNTLSFEPGLAYTKALLHQLQEALQRVELPPNPMSVMNLLTWQLFVGAHISRTRAERPWFIQHLARAVHMLGLESADQLRELLYKFFYMKGIYWRSLPQIWIETRTAARGLVASPSNLPKI